MFPLTYQNHFKFGRSDQDEALFIVSCEPVQRKPLLPFQESIQSAQLIYESAQNEKIKLCLSGGIDSECMLRSFIEAGVPFEVVFLKFKNNLNDFDIKTNKDFCDSKGIKYSLIDLDIIHFFESGLYLEIAEKYECQSPQIATHLWLLDQMDGVAIMGGNPIAPLWKDDKWFFIGLPGELHSVYFAYFMMNGRQGVPWFFLYTPEQISSFFYLDCMQSYLQKKVTQPSDYTYLEKCKSYQQGGFSVVPRENKFTGFEAVRKHYDDKYNGQYGTVFDQLFRKPLEELFPFPEKYLQLIPKNYFPYEI